MTNLIAITNKANA